MSFEAFVIASIWTGATAYFALSVFFVYGWFRRLTGRVALAAALVTTAWFVSLGSMGERPVTQLLEVTAYATWILLVARVLGVSSQTLFDPAYRSQVVMSAATAVLYVIAVVVLISQPSDWSAQTSGDAPVVAYLRLSFALAGLVMLEQMYGNTRRDHRWNLKFLTVGLGTLFGYAFVLNADQVLFRAFNPVLFAPLGLTASVAVPFIAIASLRNRNQRLNFNMSRRFVFRTGVLVIAGAYLLAMGTAGYYVRFFGGQWGEVFQVLVIAAGIIALAVIATSTSVRNRLRVAMSRNLFEYKYDYREEWLKVTRELTDPHPDDSLGQRAIHCVGDLVNASSGRHLTLSERGVFVVSAAVLSDRQHAISPGSSQSLLSFWRGRDWIIDLDEYRRDRSRYPGLELEEDTGTLATDRFMVPLIVEDEVIGMIILGKPQVPISLIWEDYDILKVAARQAAGYLALKAADDALATAVQFRAMDQLSAFVVHDLKTVTSQLGLLVQNAERHRANPEFVTDMIKTTEHAVARMNRLLAQLRTHDGGTHDGGTQSNQRVRLVDVTAEAVERYSQGDPRPHFDPRCGAVYVAADHDRLVSVIGHIIENGQQATNSDGRVDVIAATEGRWAIVTVRDNGCGMSADFVEHQLFAPFATTKGITGIGIGVYQTREYLRSLGGDVSVRSAPGHGSEFTLRLPMVEAP